MSRLRFASAVLTASMVSLVALQASDAEPVYRHKVPFTMQVVDPTPKDTTPDAFSFTPMSGLELEAPALSNVVSISGIDSPTPASVSGQGSPMLLINGIPVGSSGTVHDGDTIQISLIAASSPGTTRTATVNVGGVTANFQVTTRAADSAPDSFSIAAATGVQLNTLTTSSPFTPMGFLDPAPVTVSGDGSPQVSIGGGSWTTSGTVSPGQSIQVRLTSAATTETTRTATVTVGGVSATFSVTTRLPDTTPDAFTIAAQTGVARGATATSDEFTPVGYTEQTSVSVSGDGSPQISVNGGAFSPLAQNINPGDTLRVRVTAAGTYLTPRNVTVTVGGVSATFSVTTIDFLGTAENPATSCYEIQQDGESNKGSQTYTLGKGATPYSTYCDMTVASGGWTKINGLSEAQVNAALGPAGSRQMMLKCSDGGTQTIVSPTTSHDWSWTTAQAISGQWLINGVAKTCNADSEFSLSKWGWGCSNGPGVTNKIYPGHPNGDLSTVHTQTGTTICGNDNYSSYSIFVR